MMARLAAATALALLCSVTVTSAFVPPHARTFKPATAIISSSPSSAGTANTHLNSLFSDQLSQLSYDNAFIGKASTAVQNIQSAAAAESSLASSISDKTATDILHNLPNVLRDIPSLNLPPIPSSPLASIVQELLAGSLQDSLQETLQEIQSNPDKAWQSIQQSALSITSFFDGVPPAVLLLFSSIVTYTILNAILNNNNNNTPPPSSPYPMNRYDPISARRYFDSRPLEVLSRAVQVTLLSGTFLSGLGLDYVTGKLGENSERRAEELSVLLTKLGPSFIKIGQSLSIRTDLLSPAYVRGLKTLQDQVPPFSTTEARDIIESELGSTISSTFINFPNEPIAAASLGQVYKATVRSDDDDGMEKDVAVKHPGNLLRTTDGRLCILDWGMVTRLDPDLQITLIEHMAHLTSADYDEIPKDLLLLGFIPKDQEALIKDSGVVETLAGIYGAWTKGGGAAAVNVNQVIADLQDLTAEKGNLFQIPPYFAYIAKSFSVLEGIGLSNEPNYSIINECLPYVSKRLLTDKSERTGGALQTFIFGPKKNDADRIIDFDRVEQLVSGFGSYTTSASGELLGKNRTRTETIENVATQILDLLATEEETPLQQIFIEQLAKVITSSSRSVWSQLREQSGKLPSGRTLLGTLVDPLGVFRTSPVVRPSELDERTVETTRNLIKLLSDTNTSPIEVSSLTNSEIVEISSLVVGKLWERRTGVLRTGNRLFSQLLELTANKLEKGEREILVIPTNEPMDSPDGRIHVNDDPVEQKKQTPDSDRLESAKRILALAEQG
eukprot:scaffold22285_cov70-Cyclotella_meneghiniana.AAC.1